MMIRHYTGRFFKYDRPGAGDQGLGLGPCPEGLLSTSKKAALQEMIDTNTVTPDKLAAVCRTLGRPWECRSARSWCRAA